MPTNQFVWKWGEEHVEPFFRRVATIQPQHVWNVSFLKGVVVWNNLQRLVAQTGLLILEFKEPTMFVLSISTPWG